MLLSDLEVLLQLEKRVARQLQPLSRPCWVGSCPIQEAILLEHSGLGCVVYLRVSLQDGVQSLSFAPITIIEDVSHRFPHRFGNPCSEQGV